MPLRPSLNTTRCEKALQGRLRRVWRSFQHRVCQQAGFTVVEVAVAAAVLVIGLLTTFSALDLTVHTSLITRAREGAINLARQITEDSRSLQYSQLTSSSAVTSLLQAMPGLASTSGGSTWTVYRRNITYTVSVTETDLPAVSLQTLSQKQIGVTISWTLAGKTRTYTETSTLSSGGQGVNMSASSLLWSNPSNCSSPCTTSSPVITVSMGVTTMYFSVQTPSGMSGVAWEVNGIAQSWTVGTPTAINSTTEQWTTTTGWDTTNLPDGTYEIGAAAQNGSATGNYVRIYVKLTRGIPSAPSFTTDSWAGAGFNTNFYTTYSSTKLTVAELDWSGSNNPSVTSNSGDYNVIGYQITNPSGTVICKTAVTSGSGLTSSFPGSCGINGATVWCASPTACTDESPPSTSGSQTYSVAALYYNSSNVLTAGPSASIALSGTAAHTYYLGTTTANTSTNCPTGTSQKDLATSSPTGTTATTLASTGSSVTATFCGPAFTQSTNITTGGTATLYVRNAASSSCTINGYLSINGGLFLSSSVSVPSNAAPTAYNLTWAGGSTWTLNSGDRLDTQYTWSCGSSTKPVTLYWNSTGDPSKFTTNAFPIQASNPPTSLAVSSVTTNSDGTTNATLTWTAPSSGPGVHGYRIYRDGQNYSNRYAYDSTTDLCSGTSCTWTDADRTGTHTYAVSAVGNTTSGSNMAESTFAGPTSAQ
jgi:Tfp pilus assembly protein PilV